MIILGDFLKVLIDRPFPTPIAANPLANFLTVLL
jgi:hypothetical protein